MDRVQEMMRGEPLFPTLIGATFASLPQVTQRVHDGRPSKTLVGHCVVERGNHPLVKLIAPFASLPSSGAVALRVTIAADGRGETWTRDFGGHIMRSRLWAKSGLLAERLGAITLLFRLQAAENRIEWTIAGARLLGVPLPESWFAGAAATESVVDGRYSFDVRATLPVVGLLVHYAGWLDG